MGWTMGPNLPDHDSTPPAPPLCHSISVSHSQSARETDHKRKRIGRARSLIHATCRNTPHASIDTFTSFFEYQTPERRASERQDVQRSVRRIDRTRHIYQTLEGTPFLAHLEAQSGFPRLSALWNEYSSRSGTVINELVVPYEEYPDENRRADQNPSVTPQATEGDGIVLLIHVLLKQKVHSQDTGSLSQPYEIDRLSLCSGFALNAKPSPMSEEPACKDSQGDLIVSCAHTLEEVGNAQNRTRPRTID